MMLPFLVIGSDVLPINITKERQMCHWFLIFANNRGKEVCQHPTEKLDLCRSDLMNWSSRLKGISQAGEPRQSKTNSRVHRGNSGWKGFSARMLLQKWINIKDSLHRFTYLNPSPSKKWLQTLGAVRWSPLNERQVLQTVGKKRQKILRPSGINLAFFYPQLPSMLLNRGNRCRQIWHILRAYQLGRMVCWSAHVEIYKDAIALLFQEDRKSLEFLG